MRKLLVTGLLLFGFLAFGPVSTAYAQNDSADRARQVEALSAEGAEHFGAGEFEEAIARFEEAYEIEPVPNLLYNIGRCYEQLEEWAMAEQYFEEFIRSPDVDSEARDHAMDRVQSLREIQAAGDDSDEVLEPDEAVAEPDEGIDEPEDKPNMLPAYGTLGAGAALVGGGILMGVLANGSANTISDANASYEDRLSAQRSARTQSIAADVFYITGALALGTGLYLLLTTGDSVDTAPDGTATRSITPWFHQDSAGIGVHVDF